VLYRCTKESIGPAFLCLLGHKYGYRPLPASIDQQEFETLRKHLDKSKDVLKLLDAYYRLDMNAIPPEYVLKHREDTNTNWQVRFQL